MDTSVLLGAPGGQGGKARHEEVEAREGDHVDRQLAQVSIQLPREPVHISIFNFVPYILCIIATATFDVFLVGQLV